MIMGNEAPAEVPPKLIEGVGENGLDHEQRLELIPSLGEGLRFFGGLLDDTPPVAAFEPVGEALQVNAPLCEPLLGLLHRRNIIPITEILGHGLELVSVHF